MIIDHSLITTFDVSMCFLQAAQVCSNCGVNMGEYFCSICIFYDDDVKNFGFSPV